MSSFNQVVWSEGLFLRPQHLQQQTRYFENLLESRCGPVRSFAWGFTELKLDQALLASGKLAVESARGVFPDGTPFNIPHDDPPPPPLDVADDVRETVVYLSLPVRRPGTADIPSAASRDEGLARMSLREYDVRDSTSRSPAPATLQLGCLRTRLLYGHDERAEYACLGIGQVVEVRNKQVILRDDYIAPVLHCATSPLLLGLMNEVHGLLHHRAEALAERVSPSAGRASAAEISDFLMLQAVNRYAPLISHLAGLGTLHPEQLFSLLVAIAGELATFSTTRRRPPAFEPYRHDDLRATFKPVTDCLFESLRMVLEQSAVPIELKDPRFGIWVGALSDRSVVTEGSLVLAVSADTPTEELRRRFPAQVKVAPVEKIRELVNAALPGIPITPLPVAPRQIPYHTGFVYFEAERAGEYWQQLANSSGVAIHVGGQHENLKLELWGIRKV